MTYHNDNLATPPIQLLIPLCQTGDDDGRLMVWLHGYCLVTIRPVGPDLQLSGRITLGGRYRENLDLIRGLACALQPGAVIAGYDLHHALGRLGKLAVDANDPKPALALLARLGSMLGFHDPLDLAVDDQSQTEVAVQCLRLPPGVDQETRDALDDELFEAGFSEETSLRPHRVTAELLDNARAYIGTIAELYFPEELRPAFIDAWDAWELSVQPQIAALAQQHQIGGEPITIS